MRLTPREVEVIRNSILKLDPKAKIFLYGSRVQDHLKGGDIDVLVISDHLKFKDRLTIVTDILLKIGEQKFDLLIKSESEAKSDAFVQSILKSAAQI